MLYSASYRRYKKVVKKLDKKLKIYINYILLLVKVSKPTQR